MDETKGFVEDDVMECIASGDHWMEVELMEGMNLCRRHRLILKWGGIVNITARVNTKGWRFGKIT